MLVKIIRTVDRNKRITIPSSILKEIGLKEGDNVYFEITKNGNLLVKKATKEKK